MGKIKLAALVVALAFGFAYPAAAVGPEVTLQWLQENQNADVQFKAGDVLTFADVEKLRAFVPPAYQDIMFWDGMEIPIAETSDLSPADSYKQATLQHQGQVAMADDGAIENYVAGFAFKRDDLTPESKIWANGDGFKAIWTYNFRWQAQGLELGRWYGAWFREGGTHESPHVEPGHEDMFMGGGTIPRILWGHYHRAYFNFRADLADQGYRVKGRWADNTEYRELTDFDEPFDIRGTAFLILRYTDPRRADDSWAYIPNLRRVRRISVEVKSDSLLGTDHTIEDFYGFAGRVLEHEWRYVGKARILAIARSNGPYARFGGPNGWAQMDRWELRNVHVIEQIPTFQRDHPYARKYIFVNHDSMDCLYAESYDRANELWKVWQLSKLWTEDDFFPAENHAGLRIGSFQSINVIDKQNGRGTLFPCNKPNYLPKKLSYLKKILDVNYLSEGR